MRKGKWPATGVGLWPGVVEDRQKVMKKNKLTSPLDSGIGKLQNPEFPRMAYRWFFPLLELEQVFSSWLIAALHKLDLVKA